MLEQARRRVVAEMGLMADKLRADVIATRDRLSARGALLGGAELAAMGDLVTEYQKRRAKVALKWLSKAVPQSPSDCDEAACVQLRDLIAKHASVDTAERRLRDITAHLRESDVDKAVQRLRPSWRRALDAAQSEADLLVMGRSRKQLRSSPPARWLSVVPGTLNSLIATGIVGLLTLAYRRVMQLGVPQDLLVRLGLSVFYLLTAIWLLRQIIRSWAAQHWSALRTGQFFLQVLALVVLTLLALWAWQPSTRAQPTGSVVTVSARGRPLAAAHPAPPIARC